MYLDDVRFGGGYAGGRSKRRPYEGKSLNFEIGFEGFLESRVAVRRKSAQR
jgi:hypothetical protein